MYNDIPNNIPANTYPNFLLDLINTYIDTKSIADIRLQSNAHLDCIKCHGTITAINSTKIAIFLFLKSFVIKKANIKYIIENISAGILITVRLYPNIFIKNAAI